MEAAVLQAALESGVALLHLAAHRLQQDVLLKQFLGKEGKSWGNASTDDRDFAIHDHPNPPKLHTPSSLASSST